MIDFLERIKSELPLEILFSSWDETTLVISGEKWNFSTQSAWRLYEKNSIFLGCLSENSKEICSIVKGMQITGINFQSRETPVDLAFQLSCGYVLEIFSTDTIEPWVLCLPTLGVYVASGQEISS